MRFSASLDCAIIELVSETCARAHTRTQTAAVSYASLVETTTDDYYLIA
jgi:hypothetical protein